MMSFDIKLAKEILNWEPNISLKDGLSIICLIMKIFIEKFQIY